MFLSVCRSLKEAFLFRFCLIFLIATLFAACGGGGGKSPENPFKDLPTTFIPQQNNITIEWTNLPNANLSGILLEWRSINETTATNGSILIDDPALSSACCGGKCLLYSHRIREWSPL